MSILDNLVDFIHEIEFKDIPDKVIKLNHAQKKSVIAAIRASAFDPASKRISAGFKTYFQTVSNFPNSGTRGSSKETVSNPMYFLCAALSRSIALDFDDYLCFAHSGHSSVLVPMFFSELTEVSENEVLVAQTIANEISARLGGSCLIGPLNGQLWSFVHAGASAAVGSRLLGLSKIQSANAIALALWQAPRPTMPGFLAPDSKLMTAVDPTICGIKAAFLASKGVTGPLDIFDSPDGFFGVFSSIPIKAMFEGLNRSWLSHTLSIKRYPGCAYIDTVIDSTLDLGKVDIDSVKSIEIEASLLTCAMDKLSYPYQNKSETNLLDTIPTPVTITFSVAYNVALALLAGGLSPHELTDEYLTKNAAVISKLSKLVKIRHDPKLTEFALRSFQNVLPIGQVLSALPVNKLLLNLLTMRSGALNIMSPSDIFAVLKYINKANAIKAILDRHSGMHEVDKLQGFKMSFPARVRLGTKTNEVFESETYYPSGGAGNIDFSPEIVAEEKYKTWAGDLDETSISLENLIN
jgi:hypothetical protein